MPDGGIVKTTEGAGDSGMGKSAASALDSGMIVAAGAGTIPMSDPLDSVVAQPLWRTLAPRRFPAAAWDPSLRAQLLVAEFAEKKWRDEIKLTKWCARTDLNLDQEIKQLIDMQKNKRAVRMAEIVAQSTDFTPYFSDLLMMTASSHPASWMLLCAAHAIGHMVGMYFKDQNNRPRPVQVYPSLMPPVPTPPHPSYPNNHALQSYLIAQVLVDAYPAATEPLEALAIRIKDNREIAGLHFPADGRASIEVAKQILPILLQGKIYQETVCAAKKEWA